MPEIIFIADFSRSGGSAVQYAAAFAGDAGYALRIVYAYVLPVIVSDPIVQPMPMAAIDELRETATTRMAELITQLRGDFPDLTISQNVTYGDWEDAVSDNNATVDLIITAGDSDDGTWLGNEMHDAALHFGKPVLVIPDGARYTGLKKTCLACDAAAMENVQPIISILPFLRSTGATIELLHIHTGANDTARWNEQALAVAFDGIDYSLHAQEAKQDAVDKKIHDFATDRGADWLMLIPHHYSFFGGLFHKSHTKAAFRMGDLPVLCLY